MESKGTQTMQKIVIKKPWGVEIKDYKAGDPIPAGAKFKIFDAKDTAKIEAYADSLDESATYQKKRFKEPAYMYEEYYIKWGKKYFCNMNGDPAWGPIKDFAIPFKSREEADKYMDKMADRFPMFYYNYDVKVVKESKKVVESFLIMDTINSKPTYFHYGKYTGYDWWDDKSKATKFMTKDSAERMIEKMRQEGTDISKLKVISEGRIARGYENLDADEKARHLLSHPCSKYMADLKTGNITERAIRKAVKEMLGKPAKEDPEIVDVVNEELVRVNFFTKKGPLLVYKDGASSTNAKDFSSWEDAEKEKDAIFAKLGKKHPDIYANISLFDNERSTMKRGKQYGLNEEGCIKESAYYIKSPHGFYVMKTNNSYDLTDDKEKALKYTNGDDAAKELTYIHRYSPDSRLKKIAIVQEEGEAAAAASTTTANVANPELPLKLKESQDEDYVVKQVCAYAKPEMMKAKGVTPEILATAIGDYIVTAPSTSDIFNINYFAKVLDKVLANGKVNPNKFILQKVNSVCHKLFESLSSKTHKFKPEELKVGKKVIDKVGGKEVHGKITVNHHDLYKDNPYRQDMKGSTVVTIVTDSGRSYDVDANDNGGEFILEGCKGKKKISEGYTVIFPTGSSEKLKTIADVNKFVNGVLKMMGKKSANVQLTDAMLDKWNKENDIPLVIVKEDDETLENHFKYQTSVAGGMSSDAETCENAKEYEEKTTLVESIIKKSVKKKLTESVGQKLNITLIRKPQNMKEVEDDMRKGHGDRVKAIVDKSYKLSANEYDKFVYNFMVHTTYLSGEGGVDSDGTVHVVEITAPGKKTIYVDPEGYDYARYVGW